MIPKVTKRTITRWVADDSPPRTITSYINPEVSDKLGEHFVEFFTGFVK